jgi:Ca-activated chloride channel family protein
MARHRQHKAFAGIGREPVVLAAIVVAVLAGSVAAVRLVGSTPSKRASSCPGPTTTISVGADTSAFGWLSQLARTYTDAHRMIDGRCIAVSVREMTVGLAQQALQPAPWPGAGAPPDAWVAESSTALALVRSRPNSAQVLPARGPSIATSPIVIAAPGDAVRALRSVVPAGQTPQLADYLLLSGDPAGWGQPKIGHDEWGKVQFSTADPARTTLGASLVVAAAGAVTGTPPGAVDSRTFTTPEAKQGLMQFTRSMAKTAPNNRQLLADAGQARSIRELLTTFGLIVTYEKEVWRYDADEPPVLLGAMYPLGGALAANYPYVIPDGSWVDGLDRRAASDFRAWLLSAEVQARLGSFGLRRANGVAGPELSTPDRGLDTRALPAQPTGSSDGAAAAQAVWKLLTQRVSILALIDVSGSMAEKVPQTGRSKLAVALAAARASLQLFTDADHIGLWEFSSDLAPGRDYRELVPLGPAGGRVKPGKDRRQASLEAYTAMRPRSGTGLYDSLLAAYDSATARYQRGYVNTVVLLSDGKNDDTSGISLDELLLRLKTRYDMFKPVHVVTIAYGNDADPIVLARIAKATDGLSLDAPNPRTIGQVFLSAIGALTT